jgi:hypothetical protein
MRSRPEFNFPAFFEAEKTLRAIGWGPIYNPARMDQEAGEDPPTNLDTAQQREVAQLGASRFARRDLLCILDKLDPKRDAIALLPGWEHSTGSKAEVALARWIGLGFVLLTSDGKLAVSPSMVRVSL